MKRRLIAISILFSFMLVVVHDIIPHHHHEMEEFLTFSHEDHHHDEDHDNGKGHHDHNIPFPFHQHFSATDSFELIQKSPNLNRSLCLTLILNNSCIQDLYSIYKPDPPGICKYPEISANILSPVFISPNTLRGSPSIS